MRQHVTVTIFVYFEDREPFPFAPLDMFNIIVKDSHAWDLEAFLGDFLDGSSCRHGSGRITSKVRLETLPFRKVWLPQEK